MSPRNDVQKWAPAALQQFKAKIKIYKENELQKFTLQMDMLHLLLLGTGVRQNIR